ncbi:MAG: hypothetical protein ACR2RL_24535, partial [Gammaproteobacteria bacterium]
MQEAVRPRPLELDRAALARAPARLPPGFFYLPSSLRRRFGRLGLALDAPQMCVRAWRLAPSATPR